MKSQPIFSTASNVHWDYIYVEVTGQNKIQVKIFLPLLILNFLGLLALIHE